MVCFEDDLPRGLAGPSFAKGLAKFTPQVFANQRGRS